MEVFKNLTNQAQVNNQNAMIQQKRKSTMPGNEETEAKRTRKELRFGGGSTLFSEDLAEDVDIYMRHLEAKLTIPANFLQCKLVSGRMRQSLVDWLFHVQCRYELLNETMSLAVYLLDRTLSSGMKVSRKNLHLLGTSCLFVAIKFEEIEVPDIEELVQLSSNAFSKQELLDMELDVVRVCDFQLGRPHSIQFLRRFRFFLATNKLVYALARYISEASLLCYSLAHQKPSTIAAAALFLASYAHKCRISTRQCEKATGVDAELVEKIARELVDPTIQFMNPLDNLRALREKYASEEVTLSNDMINRLRQFGDNFE